jgi:hypothetical protein
MNLIFYLTKLFGKGFLNSIMGTKTGVTKLPVGSNNPLKGVWSKNRILSSPGAMQEAKKQLKENAAYVLGGNDAKAMANYEANLKLVNDIENPIREAVKETPTTGKVIDISTKKPITGQGLASLQDKTAKAGVDKAAKAYSASEEAMRRGTIREILLRDKRLNLPSGVKDSLLGKGGANYVDPLEVFNDVYKRDLKSLDDLDGMIFDQGKELDAGAIAEMNLDRFEVIAGSPFVKKKFSIGGLANALRL